MSQVFKTSLPTLGLDTDNAEAKKLLQAAQNEMGMIPTMYGNMANHPDLLATYRLGYDALRKRTNFSQTEVEVVFLTISYENACEYCMAAHSFLADVASNVPKEVTEALRNGEAIQDEKLNALHQFTKTMVVKRGNPSPEDAQAFMNAGYTENHILEIILAISVKIISNYSNHIFHTKPDPAFAGRAWKAPQHA